jgi:iron(III) transport system permease protein
MAPSDMAEKQSAAPAVSGTPKLPWYRRVLDPLMTKRLSGRTILTIVAVVVLLYLVIGPIFLLASSSFEVNKSGLPLTAGARWTFANYAAVFGNHETYEVLGTTLLFALGSLAVAGVIALFFSWLLERTNFPGRNVMFVLVVAPSGVPLMILSIAWSLLLNPSNGIINAVLQTAFGFKLDVYSLLGMICVQGLGMVPLTFLLIVGSMRAMNAVFEDAAETSGAGAFTTLRKITLPLLTPALLAAFIYQFVYAIKELDVPLILGLPGHVNTLSLAIYNDTNPPVGLPNYGLASTYGFFLLLLTLAPLIIYNRVIGMSSRYATLGGRLRAPKRTALGAWRWPLFALSLVYVCIALVLPVLILLFASTQPYYGGLSQNAFKRATFATWQATFSDPLVRQAFVNTLIVCLVVATVTMILSVVISWIIVRSRSRSIWILDVLSFMPHATPGVVLGLALLLVYLILPVGVYGTIWIIVIGQITLFTSLGTRLMTGSVAQLQVGLEEASAASGATLSRTWFHVIMPLLRRPFANGFLLVFMASMQNLTLPLLLASDNNTVLSSLIYSKWDFGSTAEATVLCVCMTAITLVFAVLLRGVGSIGDA